MANILEPFAVEAADALAAYEAASVLVDAGIFVPAAADVYAEEYSAAFAEHQQAMVLHDLGDECAMCGRKGEAMERFVDGDHSPPVMACVDEVACTAAMEAQAAAFTRFIVKAAADE